MAAIRATTTLTSPNRKELAPGEDANGSFERTVASAAWFPVMTWPAEVVALVGTTIATILGGIGFFLRSWMGQNKETLAQAEKRVEAAERREAEAKAERELQNKRIDTLTDGVSTQNRTITDLAAALKVMGDAVKAMGDGNREDMKKVNDGITTLLARGDRHASRT